MREFADDPQTRVHPQTVIEHFGSWNAAKREAGLVPRRFATREELLQVLRDLGEELGERRPPATSTSGAAGCRRSRSTGTPSVRSRRRFARPGTTSRSGKSGWSARSSRASGSRAAQAPAEVRRLGRGTEGRRDALDRVAGLPDVRLAPGSVGDVPVSDLGAPARAGRFGQRRGAGRLATQLGQAQRAAEAVRALVWRADRGSTSSSTNDASGRKRSVHATRPSASATIVPSGTSRFWRRTSA